jgi:hypothetical protein
MTFGNRKADAIRVHNHNGTQQGRVRLGRTARLLGVVGLAGAMTIPVQAQVNQRPLADFINAQGTTQCFTPPAQAQLGWGTGFDKTNGNANLTPGRFALIDYTGLEAKYLLTKGINLGTTVSGSVLERPLADGRALVTVDLHTKNALGWALQAPVNDVNTDPLVFGARVLDVVAGKTPALGASHFHAEFVITIPGAPLPDLVGANYDPIFCPNVVPYSYSNIDFLSIQASITGPLHAPYWPEGALGRLDVNQVGKPNNPRGGTGPLSDAYPVEFIALTRIGH